MLFWPFRLTFHRARHPRPEQSTIILLGLAALLLPFFLQPDPAAVGTHTQLLLAPCLFYRLTQIPCPACGMTTSFTALTRGHWRAAFLAHPLGPPCYLYLAVLVLVAGIGAARGYTVGLTWRARPAATAAVIVLAWGCRLTVWVLSRAGLI
ncbi:MAG: DUF2752 domain-containing protein [Bacteroidota bacterium]